jgi:RHS repeat-associated protein
VFNTAGQLTSSEFATFTPDATGRIAAISHKLMRSNGTGSWSEEAVPMSALYDATGRLLGLNARGSVAALQWNHAYTYDANGNRASAVVTQAGITSNLSYSTNTGTNRLSTAAGAAVTTNAAGDITSLLGKTLAYDAAGRLSEATAVPPCPSGLNCAGAQTTLSRFNGWGQRFLRDTPNAQTIFSYGTDGHNLLSETTRNLSTSALSTTEHIWLPTASGPMPIATVINGTHYAVHADHLNTTRRLSDSAGQTRWQWPYSGFGEIAPQATPASGQTAINYSLRYPGQVDDGNGLFYNWHRFYDPRVGRYTSADPIGLEGGWNRFGYVGGNPLGFTDPTGTIALQAPTRPTQPEIPPINSLDPIQVCGGRDDAQKKCQAQCEFELDFPGRRDNLGPYRACIRRCLARYGFSI